MKLLIAFHVLSAIIGIGPTFFMHALLRKSQTAPELRHSLGLLKHLEKFPKIGGPLAVLSGIALVLTGNYGSFWQIWLVGALAVFVVIQIIVIGLAAPLVKRLAQSLQAVAVGGAAGPALSPDQTALLGRAGGYFAVTSALAVVLFLLMILRPA